MLFLIAASIVVVGSIFGEVALRAASQTRVRRGVPGMYRMGLLASALLLGGCGDPQMEVAQGLVTPVSTDDFPPAAAQPSSQMTLYAHDAVNIRSQPSRASRIVRTLRRGESVSVGDASDGWSPVIVDGRTLGYVSQSVDALRLIEPDTTPPLAQSSAPSRESDASAIVPRRRYEARGYHVGPRGGCYTYSASGKKRYVDRSNCRD